MCQAQHHCPLALIDCRMHHHFRDPCVPHAAPTAVLRRAAPTLTAACVCPSPRGRYFRSLLTRLPRGAVVMTAASALLSRDRARNIVLR